MFKIIIIIIIILGIKLNASIFESAAYEITKMKIIPFENTPEETKDYNKSANKMRIKTSSKLLFKTNKLASKKYNKAIEEYNKKIQKGDEL